MGTAELAAVSMTFGRHVALQDVTLDVHQAEVLGIVGPNGAGKTTLLRVLAGILPPSSGAVRRDAGHVVRYFGGERTLPSNVGARTWLGMLNAPVSAAAPSRRFGVLSRGTRQRVGLEAVIGSVPSLLLLDEPWEGLDPDPSRWLSEALAAQRAAGSTIVVSSHRIHDLASTCNRCAFLIAGRVAAESVVCDVEATHEQRVAGLLDAFEKARG
jgi:ABC-type multidrug transport system ATPase subunit